MDSRIIIAIVAIIIIICCCCSLSLSIGLGIYYSNNSTSSSSDTSTPTTSTSTPTTSTSSATSTPATTTATPAGVAAVSSMSVGAPVKCYANGLRTDDINNYGSIYRYIGNNTLSWYPDPTIAGSCDPNWAVYKSIDCAGLTLGPNMKACT